MSGNSLMILDEATIKRNLDEVVTKVAEVLAEVDEFTIETQDEYEMSAALLGKIKAGQKRIEDWRTSVVRPLNAVVGHWNDVAKEHSTPLASAERKIKAAVADYVLDRERERKRLQAIEDEKRMKEIAEAEEKRKQQIAEAEAMVSEFDDPELAETAAELRAIADTVPEALVAPAIPVVTMTKAAGVSVQEVIVPEFDCPSTFGVKELQEAVELALKRTTEPWVVSTLKPALDACVPASYLNISPKMGELKTFAKNSGGNVEVNGVTWKRESVVSARAR